MGYNRLIAEMIARKITKKDVAFLIGKSVDTVSKKINGKSDFTLNEVMAIMEKFFKGESVDYIFTKK